MTDEELWNAFRGVELPHDRWTHRAHLRVAWMHLARWTIDEAHVRMRAGIIRLNASHGLEESPARGYHETLTRVWLCALAAARSAAELAGTPFASSDAFCDAHPELFERHYPLRFYSRERLLSVEARAMFLPPDLAELPGAAR